MMSSGPTKLTDEQFIAQREQRFREVIAQAENELREQRERSERSRKQRVTDAIDRAHAAGGI